MKNTKITVDYKKLCRSITILFLLIITIICFSANLGNAMIKEQKYEIVYIHPGDTLWEIAQEYNTGDIRKTINKIKKFNNMKTSELTAHDTIKIPID